MYASVWVVCICVSVSLSVITHGYNTKQFLWGYYNDTDASISHQVLGLPDKKTFLSIITQRYNTKSFPYFVKTILTQTFLNRCLVSSRVNMSKLRRMGSPQNLTGTACLRWSLPHASSWKGSACMRTLLEMSLRYVSWSLKCVYVCVNYALISIHMHIWSACMRTLLEMSLRYVSWGLKCVCMCQLFISMHMRVWFACMRTLLQMSLTYVGSNTSQACVCLCVCHLCFCMHVWYMRACAHSCRRLSHT
jgi:hypothetical protein